MFKKTSLSLGAVIFLIAFSSSASAACEIVEGKYRKPFDGKALDRVQVEKKSLTTLNLEFPHLNAIERTFKGELQTCSSCEGKHIVCSDEL